MASAERIQTIHLPELVTTRFDLVAASLIIRLAASDGEDIQDDIVEPRLLLQGKEDAFKHNFEDGRLEVEENNGAHIDISSSSIQVTGSNNVVIEGVSAGSVVFNGVHMSGGISINGSSEPRVATLVLPARHASSHSVATKSGSVEVSGVNVMGLNAETMSGRIAVDGASIANLHLNTMTGNIDIEDISSSSAVTANTMTGNVDIQDSSAAGWNLSTKTGNISVKNTSGAVEASSMTGKTRIG